MNEKQKASVRKEISEWLLSKGFVQMDDGTYHHIDSCIRVEFKKRVVRVDRFVDEHRWGYSEWSRVSSAYYNHIIFEVDGRPRGLGFYSFKELREITA